MESRSYWISEAEKVLREAASLLSPYGLRIDPALKVDCDQHPIPGYLHSERKIVFCPPVIEDGVGRLRWMFFLRYMGCETIEEARRFYGVALPLVICHELSHHLRFSLDMSAESMFVEEQVCDRLAVAMVEAMSGYRDSLMELGRMCGEMSARLAGESKSVGYYLPNVADVLVASSVLDRDHLARLEQITDASRLELDQLIELLPSVGSLDIQEAKEARSRAQQYLDTRYIEDAGTYWLLSLRWMHSYLVHHRFERPTLQDALQNHLLGEAEERQNKEVIITLRAILDSMDKTGAALLNEENALSLRVAAGEGMIDLAGDAGVQAIVERLETSSDDPNGFLDALGRAASKRRDLDSQPVYKLLRRISNRSANEKPETLRRALRVAALWGLRDAINLEALRSRAAESAELAVELAAVAPEASSKEIEKIAADPDKATLLLRAWDAWGRTLLDFPSDLRSVFLKPAPSPRLRSLLLRLSAGKPEALTPFSLDYSLEEILSAGSDGPEQSISHIAALHILDSIPDNQLLPAIVSNLPKRGSPRWSTVMSILNGRASSVENLLKFRNAPSATDKGLDKGFKPLVYSGNDPLIAALRAAAALSDLKGSLFEDVAGNLDVFNRVLDRCFDVLGAASAIMDIYRGGSPDTPTNDVTSGALRLAADVLSLSARRGAFELILAVAPAAYLDQLMTIIEGKANDSAPLDEFLVDLLVGKLYHNMKGLLKDALLGRIPAGRPVVFDNAPQMVRELISLAGERAGGKQKKRIEDLSDKGLKPLVRREVAAGRDRQIAIVNAVYLRQAPIFAALDPASLFEIAGLCELKDFPKDGLIVREGEQGNELYVILDGQVAVERIRDGGRIHLSTLGPLNWFGEMALFDPDEIGTPRSADVRALDDCRLLCLSKRAVTGIARGNPAIYEAFLRALSSRLRTVDERIAGATGGKDS